MEFRMLVKRETSRIASCCLGLNYFAALRLEMLSGSVPGPLALANLQRTFGAGRGW
jgi:hypothetical protein